MQPGGAARARSWELNQLIRGDLAASSLFDFFRYYINYKLMKKKVKQYGQQLQQGEKDRRRVLKDFSKMLDDQVMLRNRNL